MVRLFCRSLPAGRVLAVPTMAAKMQVRMAVRALMTEPMHRAKYGIISLAKTAVRATGAYRRKNKDRATDKQTYGGKPQVDHFKTRNSLGFNVIILKILQQSVQKTC